MEALRRITGGAGSWLVAGRAWEQIQAQRAALLHAQSPADAFLDEHRRELQMVRVGATFSPEHCHALLLRRGIHDETARHEQSLSALDFLQRQLGVADIRLPIRWDRAVSPERPRLDMRFYEPYLDHLIERKGRICLNVGPLKAARWPEYHLPEWLPQIAAAIPPPGSVIHADSELAKHGREHLVRLIEYLKARYSPAELAHITMIQPENEPFSYFGRLRLFLGTDYMQSIIAVVRAHFPEAKILVNSMGIADVSDFRCGISHVETIARLFADILRHDPGSRGRLVSGFDYYHYVAGMPRFLRLGTLDQVTLTNIRKHELTERNKAVARAVGFEVEVTEGQMEPWGSELPGNSLEHLQFVLKRCLTIVNTTVASTVRVWGAEGLAVSMLLRDANSAHRGMCSTIAAINAL
jgi:hypothetical protein